MHLLASDIVCFDYPGIQHWRILLRKLRAIVRVRSRIRASVHGWHCSVRACWLRIEINSNSWKMLPRHSSAFPSGRGSVCRFQNCSPNYIQHARPFSSSASSSVSTELLLNDFGPRNSNDAVGENRFVSNEQTGASQGGLQF